MRSVTSLAELQQAAVRTFSERGFAATGIRDIAGAAGVTSGTLYMHAPSKMAFLESIMHMALDELLRLAETVYAETPDPVARIAGLIRCHVSLQAVNPRTAQVVDGEVRILPPANRAPIVEKRDAYEALWTDSLHEGVASGQFGADDVTVARLALLEMCNGIAHWYRPEGRLDLRKLQDAFVRLGLDMLRHNATAPDTGTDLSARRLPCEPGTG